MPTKIKAQKPKTKTIRTTLTIDDWGLEKDEGDREIQLEHVFSMIKEGYTSGYDLNVHWKLDTSEVED